MHIRCCCSLSFTIRIFFYSSNRLNACFLERSHFDFYSLGLFFSLFAHHLSIYLCSFAIDVADMQTSGWCGIFDVLMFPSSTTFNTIVCEECGKIEQTEATPHSIHTSSIERIGTMFLKNSLSRHFHARGNCHANRTDRITSPGKPIHISKIVTSRFSFTQTNKQRNKQLKSNWCKWKLLVSRMFFLLWTIIYRLQGTHLRHRLIHGG